MSIAITGAAGQLGRLVIDERPNRLPPLALAPGSVVDGIANFIKTSHFALRSATPNPAYGSVISRSRLSASQQRRRGFVGDGDPAAPPVHERAGSGAQRPSGFLVCAEGTTVSASGT